MRLCDFGVAAKLTNTVLKRTTMAGTPYWMAPEVITEGATYNYKADVWSAGITIYEMATGNPPYSDKDAMRAMQLLTQHEPPRLEGRQYSTLLKEVIALCLEENPNVRPSAEVVLKSKFIKSYKPLTTAPLKEIVGRYLLWRDNNNKDKADYEQSTEVYNIEEGESYDIKWDFDSLKSAEYFIDNEIEIDDYMDQSQPPVLLKSIPSNDFISTFTMNNTIVGTLGQTQTQSHTQTQTQTQTRSHTIETTSTNSQIRKEGPKSLLNLFDVSFPSPSPEHLSVAMEEPELEEEMEEMRSELSPPLQQPQMAINSPLSSVSANNSPHPIEIPIMDHRNLPPRSRSATVSMDVLPTRKPTLKSISPSKLSPPPEISDSPSKSPTHMKPLQTSISQPLLQPLNQKYTPPTSAQTITSSHTITPPISAAPENQDSLPIQMPIPTARKEATIISPNTLTRPVLHLNLSGANSPLNQFGIDAANTNGPPLAMTPVTEYPVMTNTITPEGVSLSDHEELDPLQDQVADDISISSTSSLPLLINADPQLASLDFDFGNSYDQSFEPNDTLTDTTFEDTTFSNGERVVNSALSPLDPLFVYPVMDDDDLGLEFSDESLHTIEDSLVDIINDGRDSMAGLLEIDFQSDPVGDLDTLYLEEISHMLEKISDVIGLTSEQLEPTSIIHVDSPVEDGYLDGELDGEGAVIENDDDSHLIETLNGPGNIYDDDEEFNDTVIVSEIEETPLVEV